jgi:hypothetical protein
MGRWATWACALPRVLAATAARASASAAVRRGAPLRHRAVRSAFGGAVALSICLGAADGRAFCRTTTCPLPPDFTPTPGACTPADFESYCASLHPSVKPLPVWWRNACVGYDVQKNASRQVPYETASKLVGAAFAKWTSIACDGASGSSRVSIDVRDLGPVSCDEVEYNSDHGNAHVIVFRDDRWPYDDPNNTLGLTTVTFDVDTGEIYDADVEINGTVPLAVGDPVPGDGYDFQTVITHEAGHFLGMAHSGDDRAAMFAICEPGTTTKRTLTADDTSGLCSIYPPGGLRAADPSLGKPPEEDACDPTPRHGFSSECAGAPTKGHAAPRVSPSRERSSLLGDASWLGAFALAGAAVRRRAHAIRCRRTGR